MCLLEIEAEKERNEKGIDIDSNFVDASSSTADWKLQCHPDWSLLEIQIYTQTSSNI